MLSQSTEPKLCRNGLHPKTEANSLAAFDRKTGRWYVRCLTCAEETSRRRHKVREDYCRRNLHKMTASNTHLGTDGKSRCRACRRLGQSRRYHTGMITVYCLARGCRGNTTRVVEREGDLYVCPRHRHEPDVAVRVALKVAGLSMTDLEPRRISSRRAIAA